MFKNEFGQTLIPGDKVIVVSTGRCHVVKVREGIFVGLSPSGAPKVSVKANVWGYWTKDNRRLSYDRAGDEDVVAERRLMYKTSVFYLGRVYKLEAK